MVIEITGLTAPRMLEIEGSSIVDGEVQGDFLVLVRRDGTFINAGSVRGPQGLQGVPGSITVSAAGGVLAGNYPNPDLADNVITTAKVAAANKDGAANVPSMRTLGSAATQAAPGNHKALQNSGWVNMTPTAGEAPFAAVNSTVARAQYKKTGDLVHVRIVKSTNAARDLSASITGNFANVRVMGPGSIPLLARPDSVPANGQGTLSDSPVGIVANPDGSISWVGGHPRNYPSGSILSADFMYLTTN